METLMFNGLSGHRVKRGMNGVGIAPAVVAGAVTLGKKVIEMIKIGGGIFEGWSYRKAAAAINALKAKGYTTQQIQESPLREIVDVISVWPAPIKDVLQGTPYVDRVMKDSGGAHLFPAPLGSPTKYVRPEDSNLAYTITKEIYGPNIPPPGQTEGITAEQIMSQFPPKVPGSSSVIDKAQEVVKDAAGNIIPIDKTTANIGWVVGIGILAIGAGIYFGSQPKKKKA